MHLWLRVGVICSLCSFLGSAQILRLNGAPVSGATRIIIDTGSGCRSEPSLSAVASADIPLGATALAPPDLSPAANGWYLAADHINCWIPGGATWVWNGQQPEDVALAVLERIRLRGRAALFPEYLLVERLLEESFGWKPTGTAADLSPLLRFRILQVIDDAAVTEHLSGGRAGYASQWAHRHGELLAYYETDDAWFVKDSHYWGLFEEAIHEPWAEDLAWYTATRDAHTDECYSVCLLDRIERHQMKYWTRYPQGLHVPAALEEANTLLRFAAAYACDATLGADPVELSTTARIRQGLIAVTNPAKEFGLKKLDEIDTKCRGDAPDQ